MFVCVLSLCIILISKSSFERSNHSQTKRNYTDYMGKRILLPDSLDLVFYNINSHFDYYGTNSLRIVSYMNGDCGDCIKRLAEWEKLFKEYNYLKKVNLLLFIFARDYTYIESVIDDSKLNLPVIFDYENQYIKINSLPVDFQFRTFLLNEFDNILCIGNPTYSEELRKVYQDKILSYSSIDLIQ